MYRYQSRHLRLGVLGVGVGQWALKKMCVPLSHFGVHFFALLRVARLKRAVALSNHRYVTMFVALPLPNELRVRRLSYFLGFHSYFMGAMALGLSPFLTRSSGF